MFFLSTKRFNIVYKTAKIGTPKNIPKTPNKYPKTIMEKITQNGLNPVDSPKIFGPSTIPSNC